MLPLPPDSSLPAQASVEGLSYKQHTTVHLLRFKPAMNAGEIITSCFHGAP